jgi:phenylpropionate dioxygenase-like ring-hydroxylating dioxygenase large terminal subunit
MARLLSDPKDAAKARERDIRDEARGASQTGPFDYCPRLGFREYWYPGIRARKVGKKKPVRLTMLGEELVLFRGKDGNVTALTDWCPHRGARFSNGLCDFKGTITCPYHGYVFDESGQCVAGLIEAVQSPLAPKLRAKKYPTAEHLGIVFIWMGETPPVPLEEDLPWEFKDASLHVVRYTRVKVWETNWTEPVWQGIDYHEYYLHRWFKWWHLINYKQPFFRPKPVVTNGVRIVEEGDNFVTCTQERVEYGQKEYAGLGKWPQHVWWRILKPLKGAAGRFGHEHNVQLPTIVRVPLGFASHMRWGVPMNESETRMWTFTVTERPRTVFGQIRQDLWYWLYRRGYGVIRINEKEDFPIFSRGEINADNPQKQGILDLGDIYYRRHLARRSRDFKRLGGARGCLKQPPDPEKVAAWTTTPSR